MRKLLKIRNQFMSWLSENDYQEIKENMEKESSYKLKYYENTVLSP